MQVAMDLFYSEKVDFVIVEFMSWSEDFAWIRFLRDMPEIPILFVNSVKDNMTLKIHLMRMISSISFAQGPLSVLGSCWFSTRIGRKKRRVVMEAVRK